MPEMARAAQDASRPTSSVASTLISLPVNVACDDARGGPLPPQERAEQLFDLAGGVCNSGYSSDSFEGAPRRVNDFEAWTLLRDLRPDS
jgi:hypothetical protein